MSVTDTQRARLGYAARALLSNGVTNAILRAASTTQQWSDGLALRVADELQHHLAILPQCGVDPALLPRPEQFATTQSPQPQKWQAVPAGGTRQRDGAPKLSARAVLASNVGEPIIFDGTLDGLRGVPIEDLDAIGEQNAARLHAAKIDSLHDLLMRVPLRYIDRSNLQTVDQLRSGMSDIAVIGTVTARRVDYAKGIVRFTVSGGGRNITTIFFNQAWRAKQVRDGDRVILVGDVTVWGATPGRAGVIQMQAPLMEPAGDQNKALPPMLPIYPQSGKHDVSTWMLQRAALEAVQRIEDIADPVPVGVMQARGHPTRFEALRAVHVPENQQDAKRGRDRLAYDELLRLQLALGLRRNALRAMPSVEHHPTGALSSRLLASLPYAPTGAQTRAVTQINADLVSGAPMNRLLQGDVGSGKTLVATLALLAACEGGCQAALLAPTEILASQHYTEIARQLTALGVTVGFLASRSGTKARRGLLTGLADGTVNVVIGTHAVLSDDVQFQRLGLVVIDEQHRFGVEQRAQMVSKGPQGASPDVLVMTATPIPRTAALTAFGDLDITVLDEMPPGRTPITTRWIEATAEVGSAAPTAEPWRHIIDQVRAGRQAYVVCALVEESEKAQAAAAIETAAALRAGPLFGLRVDVVTGKQKRDERAEVMARFESGELDVLVATTVIEVGVNVPNSTVITVLDAARFGMAQLHQLRGRVARGQYQGYCYLVGEAKSDVSRSRLEAMVETTDGNVLSERDLILRGAGSLAGLAQSGRGNLLVADLIKDAQIMLDARDDARQMLDISANLARYPHLRHEVQEALGDDAKWLTHN